MEIELYKIYKKKKKKNERLDKTRILFILHYFINRISWSYKII